MLIIVSGQMLLQRRISVETPDEAVADEVEVDGAQALNLNGSVWCADVSHNLILADVRELLCSSA